MGKIYLKKTKGKQNEMDFTGLDETLEDSVSRQEMELASSSLSASPFFRQVSLGNSRWKDVHAQPFFPITHHNFPVVSRSGFAQSSVQGKAGGGR